VPSVTHDVAVCCTGSRQRNSTAANAIENDRRIDYHFTTKYISPPVWNTLQIGCSTIPF
jgi:hypothetical protein